MAKTKNPAVEAIEQWEGSEPKPKVKLERGRRLEKPLDVVQRILDGEQLYRGDKLLTRKWLMQQTLHDLVYWTAMGEISLVFDPAEREE